MKINKQIFDFILNRPELLKVLLRFSNLGNKTIINNTKNKIIAKAIEGIYSAGENIASAEKRIVELEKDNIGVILNYALEAAGLDGIKRMEAEYVKILESLKRYKYSCLALKPTALIPEEQILELSKIMNNKFYYENINFDEIINGSNVSLISKPFLKLSEDAGASGVRILIDAEQSNLQPGVDLLVLYLMKRFNLKSKKPLIYNTYQMYLKDSPIRLFAHKTWLDKCKSKFAAKIVRGAYLSYESTVQDTVHPNYSICSNKIQVDANYDDAITELYRDGNPHIIVATHNLESIKNLKKISFNSKLSLNAEHAYLMGFGDKVNQFSSGIRQLEYVPYGPSDVKIPYLIRRLEENLSIFSNKI